MLYGRETWPFKEANVVRLERYDARMIKWIYNIWAEDKISAVLLGNRLQLNTMRKCLPNRQLHWLGHLERMEKILWASKYRKFEVVDSSDRGIPRKTWTEEIRRDLEVWKVSKGQCKDKNA